MRLSFLWLLLYTSPFSMASQGSAGVVDLRHHDFEENPQTKLDGIWLYAEGCLSETMCPQKEPIRLPQERLDKVGYPSFGYGTYYLTVLVDPQKPLALKIPDLLSAYEIYVNDELVGHVGRPASTAEETVSGRKVLYLILKPRTSDTLKISIPISNFTHQKRGIGAPIELGTQEDIFHQKFIEDSYDTFLAGSLILGTFFFLGLYFHGREGKMILYFTLFCFCYAYRVVGWGNYVLHDLIEIPYRLALMFEYGSFYLCGCFFALYLQNLFPQEAPKILTKVFTVLSLVWTATIFLPIFIFTQLNIFYTYLLLIGMLNVCIIFIKAVINKRPGYEYSLYSVIGILVVFLIKTMSYLEITEENKVFSIAGEMTFFLFQALILSQHFSENWKKARNDAQAHAQAKSDFLSVMSHEIRTPLNGVIGTTYHLMDSNPKEEQREDLKRLQCSSENLLMLINNILDYNRIDQGKLQLHPIRAHLRSYCQMQVSVLQYVGKQKGLSIELIYDNNLPEFVSLDKTRVGQVLTNLLGNAVKFTQSGGVTLKVDKRALANNELIIAFSVSDTGSGISELEQEKIFNAFEQANGTISREYEGAGLGLSISQKLLELMGSKIEVTSEKGVGSTFSFDLKCKRIPTSSVPLLTPEKSDFGGTPILLVEDNPMNVLIAKRVLERWNLKVTVAENGEEALKSVTKSSFDLILMDLQMPVMDGFEATARLRNMGLRMPIIALTAASIVEQENEIRIRQLDDILLKPYSPEDLLSKLRQFL